MCFLNRENKSSKFIKNTKKSPCSTLFLSISITFYVSIHFNASFVVSYSSLNAYNGRGFLICLLKYIVDSKYWHNDRSNVGCELLCMFIYITCVIDNGVKCTTKILNDKYSSRLRRKNNKNNCKLHLDSGKYEYC